MRPCALIIGLVALLCVSPSMAAQSTRKTSPSTPGAGRFRRTPLRPSTGRYQRFLEKVFEQADVDKDGRMTFTETYEWVLRLYVQINRHAPINPPSWAQVQRVVDVMDTDHSRFIAPEEFRALAEIFVRRAAARVVANKIVTLLVAPLLAEVLLRWFQRQDWLYDMVLVPFVPALAWPILTNPILGRTILMAILVSTLGGFVMGQLNNFLDHQIDRREAKALEREVAAAKSTC